MRYEALSTASEHGPIRRHGRPALALAIVMSITAACGSGDGAASPAQSSPTPAPPPESNVAATTQAPSAPDPTAPPTSETPTTKVAASTTTTAPTTTTTVTVAAPLAPTLFEAVVSDEPLPPGRYASAFLGDGLVFETTDPVRVATANEAWIRLLPSAWTAETDGAAILVPIVGALPPELAGSHAPHDPIVPDGTLELPVDVAAWIDSIDQLSVLDTGTLPTRSGVAQWWDLAVDADAGSTFGCPFGSACVGVFVSATLGVFVTSTELMVRVYATDEAPHLIGWAQAADVSTFEQAVEEIDRMVAAFGLEPDVVVTGDGDHGDEDHGDEDHGDGDHGDDH